MYIEAEWYSLNIDDFSEYNESLVYGAANSYLTFQVNDLIQKFKSDKRRSIPEIIDMEGFDRQMSQEGRDFRDFKTWKAIHFLRHHKSIDSSFDLTKTNFKLFLEHLGTLFLSLYLRDQSEKRRFDEIERSINKIIYTRQALGVKVNLELAKGKCEELNKYIYSVKNELQLEHNIFSPDLKEVQLNYLKCKGYNIIQTTFNTFKLRRNDNAVCKLFYELIRSKQDLDSLLFIQSHLGGKDRTRPSYIGFGTITSRIIVRQPSLQNLRKPNRRVIVPDDGMKFMYVDYSQFEAGIMASLSKDPSLIKLYNKDIYRDLAGKVLFNPENREEAKIIFYRYMYGDDSLSKNAKKYFQRFHQLNLFRKKISEEIKSKGKIGTGNGNFRKSRDVSNTWSLSHLIQSTASLIYKCAVLRVHKELPNVQFVIPMHDATLYQMSNDSYNEYKDKIEAIYVDEFKKICPEINPRVGFSEFA